MAQIAGSDVTYTIQEGTQKASPSDPRFQANFAVAFGNGTLTYTTGGIPLTRAKLGCPTRIDELVILNAAAGDGFLYKYDSVANTVRIYRIPDLDGDAASAQALEEFVADTTAVEATTLYVKVVGY